MNVATMKNFNSIKVRLKHLLLFNLCGLPLFQFHKGTIKTVPLQTENASILEFQFHKGTIKTVVPTLLDILISNFNSIKVRLKQITFMTK